MTEIFGGEERKVEEKEKETEWEQIKGIENNRRGKGEGEMGRREERKRVGECFLKKFQMDVRKNLREHNFKISIRFYFLRNSHLPQ